MSIVDKPAAAPAAPVEDAAPVEAAAPVENGEVHENGEAAEAPAAAVEAPVEEVVANRKLILISGHKDKCQEAKAALEVKIESFIPEK